MLTFFFLICRAFLGVCDPWFRYDATFFKHAKLFIDVMGEPFNTESRCFRSRWVHRSQQSLHRQACISEKASKPSSHRTNCVVLHTLLAALAGHLGGVVTRGTVRPVWRAHLKLAAWLATGTRARGARVPHGPRLAILQEASGGSQRDGRRRN